MKLPFLIFGFTLAMGVLIVVAFFIEEEPSYTIATLDGEPALFEVAITVTDDGEPPRSDREVVTISVGDLNRPPRIQPLQNLDVGAGDSVRIAVEASDPEGGALRFYADGLPEGASFDGETHVFSWVVPESGAIYEQLVFMVTDDGLPPLRDSETVTITSGGANRPPDLELAGFLDAPEGGVVELTVKAADPEGHALTFTVEGLPPGAVFDETTQTLKWAVPERDGTDTVYMGHGYDHPRYRTMQASGSGLVRHGRILWLGWGFGVLYIGFFISCLALGMRKKEKVGPALIPLTVGGAIFAGIMTLMFFAYRGYMNEESHGFFLALPIPTAWMIYGLWVFPHCFMFLYVFTFDRWNLTHDEVRQFHEMVAEKRGNEAEEV